MGIKLYKSGIEVMKERGIDVTKNEISAAEFEAVDLPIIVACYSCEMTMGFMSCQVEKSTNHIFCGNCAEEEIVAANEDAFDDRMGLSVID